MITNNTGPIVLIEDDPEDRLLIPQALKEIAPNLRIELFEEGEDFLNWLRTTEAKPFLILCSLHMATRSGIDLRSTIDQEPRLRDKSIPFIFFGTDTRKETIRKAYRVTVQGFFEKPYTYDHLTQNLRVILDYWSLCLHPDGD